MIATNSYSPWAKNQLELTPNTLIEVIETNSDNNGAAQKWPRDEEKDVSGPSKRPRVKEALPHISACRRTNPASVYCPFSG